MNNTKIMNLRYGIFAVALLLLTAGCHEAQTLTQNAKTMKTLEEIFPEVPDEEDYLNRNIYYLETTRQDYLKDHPHPISTSVDFYTTYMDITAEAAQDTLIDTYWEAETKWRTFMELCAAHDSVAAYDFMCKNEGDIIVAMPSSKFMFEFHYYVTSVLAEKFKTDAEVEYMLVDWLEFDKVIADAAIMLSQEDNYVPEHYYSLLTILCDSYAATGANEEMMWELSDDFRDATIREFGSEEWTSIPIAQFNYRIYRYLDDVENMERCRQQIFEGLKLQSIKEGKIIDEYWEEQINEYIDNVLLEN